MAVISLPIGQFNPDTPDLALLQGTLDIAYMEGLYNPYGSGYTQHRFMVDNTFPPLSLVTAAVASVSSPVSSFFYSAQNGKPSSLFWQFGGGSIRRAKLDGTAITNPTGASAITANKPGQFMQWGSDVLWTNGVDLPLVSVGSDTNFVAAITGTTKPRGMFIGSLNNYVIMARDATNVKEDYVFWSAINDYTLWDKSITTGADSQKLVDIPGAITGLWCTTKGGFVFKERGISFMSYSGSPFTFDFSTLSDQFGTKYSRSIIGHGRNVYFLSHAGFARINNNGYITQVEIIGNGKINGFIRQVGGNHWIKNGIIDSAFDFNSGTINWLYMAADNHVYILSYKEDSDEWFYDRMDVLYPTPYTMCTGPFDPGTDGSRESLASIPFVSSVDDVNFAPMTLASTSNVGSFSCTFKKLQMAQDSKAFLTGIRFVGAGTDSAITDPTYLVDVAYSDDPYFITGVSTVSGLAVNPATGWYSCAIEAQYVKITFHRVSAPISASLREFDLIQLDVVGAGSAAT